MLFRSVTRLWRAAATQILFIQSLNLLPKEAFRLQSRPQPLAILCDHCIAIAVLPYLERISKRCAAHDVDSPWRDTIAKMVLVDDHRCLQEKLPQRMANTRDECALKSAHKKARGTGLFYQATKPRRGFRFFPNPACAGQFPVGGSGKDMCLVCILGNSWEICNLYFDAI